MRKQFLDNIVWNSLAGPQARFAEGTGRIRRYARGCSPLIAWIDIEHPEFDALNQYCEAGESFYCAGWTGTAPSDWQIDVDAQMEQYVWDGPAPRADDMPSVRLGKEHVAQALALVELTHPGPFGQRTIELGEFHGVFDSGRLIAMAGERMHAGELREVSGICTHPDYQGRGLARKLTERLVRTQLARGQVPFLHVMSDNHSARRLYERMGFRHHQGLPVRVMSRLR